MEVVRQKTMKWEGTQICRIYLTSANSFKEKIAKDNLMNNELKKRILLMDMPRFIWCMDLATVEESKKGLMSGRIIADSIVGTQEENPWLLMHDAFTINAVEYDRTLRHIPCKVAPYHIYRNNLQNIDSIEHFKTTIWEDIYSD